MWLRRRRQSRAPTYLAAAVAAYLAWPYYGLYAFSAALESGEREALENSVDFPAVRESVKQEAAAAMAAAAAEDAKRGTSSPLEVGLMAAFAPVLIDGLVDGFVTPMGLASLLQGERFKLEPSKASAEAQPERRLPLRIDQLRYAFFASPTTFRVETTKDLVLYFQIRDWRWKLSRVVLPPSTFGTSDSPAA